MKVFNRCKGVAILLAFSAPLSFAESGADALMKSVSPTGTASGQQWAQFEGIKLSDPFLAQLFSEWQSAKELNFDINQWVLKTMRGDFAGAAHLWSNMQPRLPDSFLSTGKATQAYLTWKLGLSQSFFNQWVALLSQPSFRESRVGLALEQTVANGLDGWLWKASPETTPEQQTVLRSLDPTRSLAQATLRGWATLRGGADAVALLGYLPPNHALKIPLSETAALSFARKGDLAQAAKVLKEHLEPAIEARKDPKLLASYYLQIARLLYQAGALDGAEEFYDKIPNGVPEYLRAREELAWIYLRKGENEKLRGDMVTLSSGLFEKEFAPEVYVVRAVSNLKLCYYDKVEQDLQAFIRTNKAWAGQIEANRENADPKAPLPETDYAILYRQGLAELEREKLTLERLAKESIEAALPAVGEQKHWVEAKTGVQLALESRKKRLAQEYRRAWTNRHATLREAIRKMQFVKVELMTQIRQLSSAAPAGSSVAPSKLSAANELKSKGDMTFPFDGVVWPDELFHLRSTAQAQCLQARQ